ncbi:hypothetical protein GW17_00030863 [Ensete ventricosum]|nr:hypothetical protein GW17_00030863 [Ensete ventricosum]RZR82142.1 hypothetical protein BHM03_00008505 [Ensete ventricosum]
MEQDQAWASGRGSDDVVGSSREFTRRFAEGIKKLAENMQGDRWKKTVRLIVRMLKAVGLGGSYDKFKVKINTPTITVEPRATIEDQYSRYGDRRKTRYSGSILPL